jgi:hypothetical protein
MTIQHGAKLPRLQVRYIHNGWSRSHHKQLDKALAWLCEDLDKDRPILGLDAEGGERSIMLLQLATARRCLLLRMPSPEKVGKNERLFSDTFRALMTDRSVVKCGAELWTDVLDMWGAGRQLSTNGCANITLLHTDNDDRSDSLQTMCDKVIGLDSFRKDRQTAARRQHPLELSWRPSASRRAEKRDDMCDSGMIGRGNLTVERRSSDVRDTENLLADEYI